MLKSFKTEELPALVTVDEQSRRFTEMSRNWGNDFNMPEKKTLVLNAKHSLVQHLQKAEGESELTVMVCNQIMDLAEMARQPLEPSRMLKFLKRSNQLLNRMADQL